jgi:SEC-C motif-containing protein
MAAMSRCPCGSGLSAEECCDRFLAGPASAPTAEALMRSRYTAYVRRDGDYLRRTWLARTRPRRITFEDGLRWTGLDVLDRTGGSLFDVDGTVTFDAHFTVGRRRDTMHEVSRFVREGGEWRYVGPL